MSIGRKNHSHAQGGSDISTSLLLIVLYTLFHSQLITKFKYFNHDIVNMCIKCELVAIIRKRANLHTLNSSGIKEFPSNIR